MENDNEIYEERANALRDAKEGVELITPRQAEERQPTCKERVQQSFDNRMDDLRKLWSAYCGDNCPECGGMGYKDSPTNLPESDLEPEQIECKLCNGEGSLDEDSYTDEVGTLYEYGLSFDYVAPGTFSGQREGYFRYQISWGGPSEEFRIYAQKINDWKFSVYKASFWYLDWFDGAPLNVHGDDLEFIEELFSSFFVDSGTANTVYEEAMKDCEFDDDEEED